jgi:hypothetical protein
MPRIRPLTEHEVSPEVAAILQSAAKTFGEPLPSTGIQAYCPPILEASRALGAAPARSRTLPAELRYLVCLRVAQLVGCPF